MDRAGYNRSTETCSSVRGNCRISCKARATSVLSVSNTEPDFLPGPCVSMAGPFPVISLALVYRRKGLSPGLCIYVTYNSKNPREISLQYRTRVRGKSTYVCFGEVKIAVKCLISV